MESTASCYPERERSQRAPSTAVPRERATNRGRRYCMECQKLVGSDDGKFIQRSCASSLRHPLSVAKCWSHGVDRDYGGAMKIRYPSWYKGSMCGLMDCIQSYFPTCLLRLQLTMPGLRVFSTRRPQLPYSSRLFTFLALRPLPSSVLDGRHLFIGPW
jgi:hypothetical protein